MATYRQLSTQLEDLQARIDRERAKAVARAIAEIHARIEEYDITPEELGFTSLVEQRAAARRKRAAAAAKPVRYRNPETGETWSGRGRAPGWLGADRSRFLIP